MSDTQRWYFTFGTDHPMRSKCYVTIAGGYTEARARMTARFGSEWSHQYKSAEAAGVEKFGLRKLDNAGMYELLKLVRVLPLHPIAIEAFLYGAGGLVVVGELTTDDWVYIARLILFRITRQRKEKANGIKTN